MTGESEPHPKTERTGDHGWLLQGTYISHGTCDMLVVVTGDSTAWGRVMPLLDEEPLSRKDSRLARQLGSCLARHEIALRRLDCMESFQDFTDVFIPEDLVDPSMVPPEPFMQHGIRVWILAVSDAGNAIAKAEQLHLSPTPIPILAFVATPTVVHAPNSRTLTLLRT